MKTKNKKKPLKLMVYSLFSDTNNEWTYKSYGYDKDRMIANIAAVNVKQAYFFAYAGMWFKKRELGGGILEKQINGHWMTYQGGKTDKSYYGIMTTTRNFKEIE